MNLEETAQALVADGKGILAADETARTISKRFEALGIASTAESRRAYRQMLFTTPDLASFISGAILYDETIRQSDDAGVPLAQVLSRAGILPGIKVDTGARPLAACPGERVTEGLDGLRARLNEYRSLGARFAKWGPTIQPAADNKSATPANGARETLAAAFCTPPSVVVRVARRSVVGR